MSKLDTVYTAADIVDDVVTTLGIKPTAYQRARAEAAVIERLDQVRVKWIARADAARSVDWERNGQT